MWICYENITSENARYAKSSKNVNQKFIYIFIVIDFGWRHSIDIALVLYRNSNFSFE